MSEKVKELENLAKFLGQMMPEITDGEEVRTIPKNAIRMRRDQSPDTIVSGMRTNRDMTKILRAGPDKTCTFPNTVTTVCAYAFHRARASSVRLNEGLRVLKHGCFASSGIRRLVLPSSVESIDAGAFCDCRLLEYADLRAAHSLKAIGDSAFNLCQRLRRVLLNDGLETIGGSCFLLSCLKEVTIPGSVRKIGRRAFSHTHLRCARFRGAPARDSSGCSGES